MPMTPQDWLPDPVRMPRPRKLRKADEVVGGVWDTRHPAKWKPQDAGSDTAYSANGKPMRVRFQCCRQRRRDIGGGRCANAVALDRSGPHGRGGKPVADHCSKHGTDALVAAQQPAGNGMTVGQVQRWRFRDFLEGDLTDRYTALADSLDEQLDPRELMAVMDLHIQELLRRSRLGDTQQFRSKAVQLYDEVRTAQAEDDQVRTQAALAALGDYLQLGTTADTCMDEAVRLADRRLQRGERLRTALAAQADTLTRARVVSLLGEFVQVLQTLLGAADLEVVLGELDRRVLSSGPLTVLEHAQAPAA